MSRGKRSPLNEKLVMRSNLERVHYTGLKILVKRHVIGLSQPLIKLNYSVHATDIV
jgi:hypothetical protein